jgi:hypothetical protein
MKEDIRDKPIINIDADHTLFNHHLYNNPEFAFYAAVLIERIEKAENSDEANKNRELFRKLFFKSPNELEQALKKSQLELGAYVAIASYSQDKEEINYFTARQNNPKKNEEEYNSTIELLEKNIQLTEEEKLQVMKLSGESFLRKAFETAFPDITLAAVSSFLPDDQLEGKTRHIKENISYIYNIPYDKNKEKNLTINNKLNQQYKKIMHDGNCLLIDDSPNNIQVYNREATKNRSTIKGIIVGIEHNAISHVNELNKWINNKQLVEIDHSSEESLSIDDSKDDQEDELKEFNTVGDLDDALRNHKHVKRIKATLIELSQQNGENSPEGLFRNILANLYVNKTSQSPYRQLSNVIDKILGAPSEAMRGTESGEGFGMLFGTGGHFTPTHCIAHANQESVLHDLNEQLQHPESAKENFEQSKKETKQQEKTRKEEIAIHLKQELQKNPGLFDEMINAIKKTEKRMQGQIYREVYRSVAWERKNGVKGLDKQRARSKLRRERRKEMRALMKEQGISKKIDAIKDSPNRAEELVKLLIDSDLVTPDVMEYYVGQLQDKLVREKFFTVGDYFSRQDVLTQLINYEKQTIENNPNTDSAKDAHNRLALYEYLSTYNLSEDELGDINYIECMGNLGDINQYFLDTMDELHEILKHPQSLEEHLANRSAQIKEQPNDPSKEAPKVISDVQFELQQDSHMLIEQPVIKIDLPPLRMVDEQERINLINLKLEWTESIETIERIQLSFDISENVPDKLQDKVDLLFEMIDQVENNLNTNDAPQDIPIIMREIIEEVENIKLEFGEINGNIQQRNSDNTDQLNNRNVNRWGKVNGIYQQSNNDTHSQTMPHENLQTLTLIHDGNVNQNNFSQNQPTAVRVPVGPGQFLEYLRYSDRLEFKAPENINNLPKDQRGLYTPENIEKVYMQIAVDVYNHFNCNNVNITGNKMESEKLFCCVKAESSIRHDMNSNQNQQMDNKIISLHGQTNVNKAREAMIRQSEIEINKLHHHDVNNSRPNGGFR